jgi:hypothetical protein
MYTSIQRNFRTMLQEVPITTIKMFGAVVIWCPGFVEP